jgi:tetratricopeptide (TPR) repeat protein
LDNLDQELQTFDDERQMRSLVNAIAFADGFSLLFVRANQIPQQESLVNQIKANLPDKYIEVIRFDEPIENLLDELQKRLDGKKPDAIFCYSLNNSFPTSTDNFKSPFVVTLNHSRNSFKRTIECPLVLFLPEFAMASLYHGAVDFYSIRSGVYLFAPQGVETDRLITQQISQNHWEADGLLFEERQNRIETIKNLLDEYQSLPDSQRNIDKEYRLKLKLADFYKMSAEYEKASNIYKEIIEFARNNNNKRLLSPVLANLASVYGSLGNYEKAIALFQEAIKIAKNTVGTNHPIYAIQLNNLAGVYGLQEKYNEAIELYLEAIEVDKNTIGTNHPEYAARLNNLASIYNFQGRNDEAEKLLEEALIIDKNLLGENHISYATSLHNLGSVYRHEKKYDEAMKLYQEAIKIAGNTIGANHPDFAIILSSISQSYFSQNEFKKALHLVKDAYEILKNTFGEDHPRTQNMKKGVGMCRQAIAENKPTPYKKRKPRRKAKKS